MQGGAGRACGDTGSPARVQGCGRVLRMRRKGCNEALQGGVPGSGADGGWRCLRGRGKGHAADVRARP